jgi:hypothetical protein
MQALRAQWKANWNEVFAEHGVHLMHEYARLIEIDVMALVGWYISQRPDRANLSLQSVIDAFREGINNNDQGVIDSKLSELQGLVTRIRNSREKWFSERRGIEAVSRDLGDAILFATLNCNPRA